MGRGISIIKYTVPGIDSNADCRINGTGGNDDTGLYELYKNVVERFVNKMIAEGDDYRNSQGAFDFTNNEYQTWTSRTGDIVNQSISYCNGCKNTYEDFWQNVTSCKPPAKEAVDAVDKKYQGGVQPAPNCQATGAPVGTSRYPGLYQDEQRKTGKVINKIWTPDPEYTRYWAFDYWTGTDCGGLVQRLVMAAKGENGKGASIPGVNCLIRKLQDTDNDKNHLDDGSLGNGQFFYGSETATGDDMVMYWQNPLMMKQDNLRRRNIYARAISFRIGLQV